VFGIVALVGDCDSAFIEAVEQRLGVRGVVIVAREIKMRTGRPFASTHAGCRRPADRWPS
jgi:hypothetical protein